MKFRKKPVVIEAVQWDGDNFIELSRWAHANLHPAADLIITGNSDCLMVRTIEGILHASLGDWIIRGVKNEYYPCKPDIFEATYEPVDETIKSPTLGI